MISRFFFPTPLPAGEEAPLPEALAHHALRVLRMRDGDALVLFDGRGGERAARLSVRGKDCVAVLQAHDPVERESPLRLVLVQGLASGDKMDWIVQKAVELGAAGVIPLEAERSVLRLTGERALKRTAHWRQVAVAACEQSGRNRVPEVLPPVPLPAYLASPGMGRRLILAPGAGSRLADIGPLAGEIHLLVGPEGGWSDGELSAATAAGCIAVGLGPRVLRTETAGLAALAAIQALWGDI